MTIKSARTLTEYGRAVLRRGWSGAEASLLAVSAMSPAGPAALRTGVVLALLTGTALVGYACFELEQALTQSADSAAGAAVVIGSFLAWGLGVLLSARGLVRRRRWARSPLVMTYLLLLAVGWALVHGTGAAVAVGVVAFGVAVVGLVVMLTPSLGAALR